MLANVVVCFLFEDPIRPLVGIQFLLLASALVLLYHYVARYVGGSIALLLCLVGSFEKTFIDVLGSGMETHLAFVALLVVACLVRSRSVETLGWREAIPLQVALAVLFFSRLDGGLLWIALVVSVLGWGRMTVPDLLRRTRALVRLLLVPALLATTYLIANQVFFCTPIPISGRIKSLHWSEITGMGPAAYLESAFDRLVTLFYFHGLSSGLTWPDTFAPVGTPRVTALSASVWISYLALLALAVAYSWRAMRREHKADLSLPLVLLYVSLHGFYYVFMQRDRYSLYWAKGPELLLLSMACAFVLSRLRSISWSIRLRRLTSSFAVLAIFALLWSESQEKRKRTGVIRDFKVSVTDFSRAIEYIKSNTAEDAILVSESIGFVGVMTGRPITSVDGLLNSVDYYENYVKAGKQAEYLRKHGADYYVNALWKGGDAEEFAAWLGSPESPPQLVAEFGASTFAPRRYVIVKLSNQQGNSTP